MTKDSAIEGRCLQMCPPDEEELRNKEKLVHKLEVKYGQLIKCYKRSAAGVEASDPNLLRPPQILQETITFLFNNILLDDQFPFFVIYQFLDDRLRSIRQDLFILQSCPDQCFQILEPIVRFYSYCAYRLCEHPIADFDPVINHNQLLETLKWLMRLYDSCEHISEERIEMETLYILFNLGEPSSLFRSFALDPTLRTPLHCKIEEISLSWYLGNYVKLCKAFTWLPPLHAALAYAVQLPCIKRFAIRVFCSAYSSKNLTVPLRYIQKLLCFNTEEEVSNALIASGQEVNNGTVKFSKTNLKSVDTKELTTRSDDIDNQLTNTFLPDLLLTCSNLELEQK